MGKQFNVAVLGATGLVGEQMVRVLQERNFPVAKLKPLASGRSLGREISFHGDQIAVEPVNDGSFKDMHIGLFSAGGQVSARYAPLAAAAGCIVIDNTSQFRMDNDVPLVVPEVNAHAIAQYSNRRIIANPNCSTIQMVVVLKPIHDAARLKRVVVSTYQAVSGAGRQAVEELSEQVRNLFNMREFAVRKFPHRIAFNCFPHIGDFERNGYTKEEMKLINETRKILDDSSIGVTATAVRVPIFIGHSESVFIETEKKLSAQQAREILSSAAGVVVEDDPSESLYPMPSSAIERDDVFVGRIREDLSSTSGLSMWIVADNVRKGAATNAVQIAEILASKYL